jgi:serine/threonine protein kinase
VQRQAIHSSTAITSVYILRPKPQRAPEERRAAGAERVRNSEFKAGDLIPGTRYRVLGLLGVGGMGSVYEVEHTELGKRFVLKMLLSQLAPREDLVARLRNEQRALGRLEHPNIVAVTDAGVTSANAPYFVMERLDGETLGARLFRSGILPVREAIDIAAGVLDGLAAAHQIGVVHRDIKPQNIFIAAKNNEPKILDFGVAKVADKSGAITARGVAVGTPRYMSPEQASGDALDGRSDVYAVGLLLFECVVGKGPFDDARDANEMLLAHLSHVAPRLSLRARAITPELDDFVARLLAKDREQRPRSAGEAAAALRALAKTYAEAQNQGFAPFTLRLNPGGERAPTTHADGVAARQAWRAREGTTEDAKTLARIGAAPSSSDTIIDEQDPLFVGRSGDTATLRELTGAGVSTRTEILPIAHLAGNDLETHTKIPLTPTNGSRTLHPAPAPKVNEPKLARRAGIAVAGALGVGLLGLLAVREFSGQRAPAAPGSAEPQSAVAAPPVARPPGSVAARALSATPPVAAPPARPAAAKAAPSVSATAPAGSAPAVLTHKNTAKSADLGAPPAPALSVSVRQERPKKARAGVANPKVPDGLPGSGL